jgi:hypothetical protein
MAPLSTKQHLKTATIGASKDYPNGRFPTGDVKHARLALEMLPRAKNMTAAEDKAVEARARRKIAAARVTGR